MKQIELVGLDQTFYYEKLKNGLEVYLVPYQNKKNYSVHFGTKFGSIHTKFTPVGEEKERKFPDGIAHFLEHKMFEQENGVDPFSFYSKTGTDCNASTTWKSTRYLFEGTNNLEENLDYLLTYVNSPYFTDENVETEKGIIAEEIKMYDDDPDWKFERYMKESTFHLDPIRVDIAGTVESIYQITKEDLYACYHTFYQPSNMFLIATGNIDPEKIMNVIRKNKALNEKQSYLPFQEAEIKEPKTVKTKRLDVDLNISNTRVGLTIKLPWKKEMDRFLYDVYCGALLSLLFGTSSIKREEMRKKQLTTTFYYMREFTKDYLIFNFVAQTEEPDTLVEFILDNLKNTSLEERDFERIKKVWISSEVIMIDNINLTLDNLYYDLTEFGRVIPNKVELIRGLNFQTLLDIRKELNFDQYSVVVAKAKKE